MKYAEYAGNKYAEILAGSPANCCEITRNSDNTILDMGVRAEGGWTSVKLMADALIGGRGIVNITRDFRGQHQFPAVEMFYDDPVGAYREAYAGLSPIIGIKESDRYVFGVSESNDLSSIKEKGSIAVVGNASLANAVLDTTRALPEAIALLLDRGIQPDDILWAWSYSPIATLSDDPAVLSVNKTEARQKRVVSIWLRGDDAKFSDIVKEYVPGVLRLHNLSTAVTNMVQPTPKNINH